MRNIHVPLCRTQKMENSMPGHDIIVIGGSLGSLEAMRALLPGLAPDLPASVFVVWHMAAESFGLLPELLQPCSPLPIANARDGAPIQAGHIYVAPPDRHLLIESGLMRLTRGPKENRFRPAVDPLFRSAAAAYGPRVVGVILSGALDDGTAGLWAIKERGGIAVVQDPLDALQPSMPRSALEHVVDYIASARELGPLLTNLVRIEAEEEGAPAVSENLHIETRIALEDNAIAAGVMQLGQPSPFTCPDCHGTLLQLTDGKVMRFRCHTGHAFSVQTLFAQISESIEDAMWNAIRTIEERVMLLQHVARHLREAGDIDGAEQLLAQSREAEQQAQIVRLAVLRRNATAPELLQHVSDTDAT